MTLDMTKRAGQYVGIAGDFTRTAGPVTYRVILYGAYDAFGLIGPEHNGIAIVTEAPSRCVVLDEHCCESTGYYGPSARQVAEFARLRDMADTELAAFIRQHPRNRFLRGDV